MKTFKKFLCSLGLAFMAIGVGAGLANNKLAVSHADNDGVKGEVTLRKVSTKNRFNNANEHMLFYLNGSDYATYATSEFVFASSDTRLSELNFNTHMTMYNASGTVIGMGDVYEAYLRMQDIPLTFTPCLLGLGNATKIELKAGLKFFSGEYSKNPSTTGKYYTLKYDYVCERKTTARVYEAEEEWIVTCKDITKSDLYDELVSDGAVQYMGAMKLGGEPTSASGHWIHLPLKTIDLRQDATNQSYFNDHANDFPVDLMSYIYINGKSARVLCQENAAKPADQQYALLLGYLKGIYAPIGLELVKDGNMSYGVRLAIYIATDYLDIDGVEITFKPFTGWINTSSNEICLTKEVAFKYVDGQFRRKVSVKFGDTTANAYTGTKLTASQIPAIPGGTIETDEYIEGSYWTIKDTQTVVNTDYVITGDIECVISTQRVYKKYNVTFKDGDNVLGTDNLTCLQEYDVIDIAYRRGYDSEWEDKTGEVAITNGKFVMPAHDLVLTVKYIPATYTLSFDVEGIEPITVTYDQKLTNLPDVPSKTGHCNGRWMVGETILTKDYVWNFIKDMTATPAYDKEVYTVTFDSNGGSSIEAQEVEYLDLPTIPNDPTMVGAEFAGWYLGEELFDFETPITSNITLTARWTMMCLVTFDSNGGSVIDPIYVKVGETLPQLYEPTMEQAEFMGWYLNGSLFDINTPITESITLVAHWKSLAPSGSGCGGSIIATSALLSIMSLSSLAILAIKRKEK